MKKFLNKEVLSAFTQPGKLYHTERLGNGLINHTYKMSDNDSGKTLLIQQINKNVFKNPVDGQANYLKLFDYKNGATDIFFPTPVHLKTTDTLYIDTEGNYWRAFEFLEGTITLDVPKD